MARSPTQRDGIVAALETLRAQRTPGVVHVHGPPRDDDDNVREIVEGERLCSQPDNDALVIFHPQGEQIGKFHRCPECGETDAETV